MEGARLSTLETDIKKLISLSAATVLSSEDTSTLKVLESSRNLILSDEEKRWRLRSHATWLKWGDSNTIFFHTLASFNRNKKLIWSIENNRAETIRGQEAIKDEAAIHFEQLYKSYSNTSLLDKLAAASLYPKMVSTSEAVDLFNPVSLQELKEVLVHFKKERSPGPDGWTIEFFVYFFELMSTDLLQMMIEDTRTKGKVTKSLNSTFLVSIPKENNASLLTIIGQYPCVILYTRLFRKSSPTG